MNGFAWGHCPVQIKEIVEDLALVDILDRNDVNNIRREDVVSTSCLSSLDGLNFNIDEFKKFKNGGSHD